MLHSVDVINLTPTKRGGYRNTPYMVTLVYGVSLGWLFPLSDLQLDFDSFVSFVVLRFYVAIINYTILLRSNYNF